jgi:hypothetical protein
MLQLILMVSVMIVINWIQRWYARDPTPAPGSQAADAGPPVVTLGCEATLSIDVTAALRAQPAAARHELQLWSAEEPALYIMLLTLSATESAVLEVEACQVCGAVQYACIVTVSWTLRDVHLVHAPDECHAVSIKLYCSVGSFQAATASCQHCVPYAASALPCLSSQCCSAVVILSASEPTSEQTLHHLCTTGSCLHRCYDSSVSCGSVACCCEPQPIDLKPAGLA